MEFFSTPRCPMLVALLMAAPTALACPGAEMASTSEAPHTELASAALDPTHCAKNAALVGSNCAWSTGQMAQRVESEGKDVQLTSRLAKQEEALASKVAAPFKAGELYVIANEVIEQADPSANLALQGKVLEVDGVKYLLVTSFQKSNT
ncbi:MAG: hypothetical protein R3F59_05645 [Myxococcota bacterium]